MGLRVPLRSRRRLNHTLGPASPFPPVHYSERALASRPSPTLGNARGVLLRALRVQPHAAVHISVPQPASLVSGAHCPPGGSALWPQLQGEGSTVWARWVS